MAPSEQDLVRRFRLGPIEAPSATDPLDSRYRYDVAIELDFGPPLQLGRGTALVFFGDLDLRRLAEGRISDPAAAQRSAKRIAYYVIGQLTNELATRPPERSFRFTP